MNIGLLGKWRMEKPLQQEAAYRLGWGICSGDV